MDIPPQHLRYRYPSASAALWHDAHSTTDYPMQPVAAMNFLPPTAFIGSGAWHLLPLHQLGLKRLR
jgi:hypothetical protein